MSNIMFRILAVFVVSCSFLSTASAGEPATPTGFRAQVYSQTLLELFWDRPATPGLRYRIVRNGAAFGETDGTSFLDQTFTATSDNVYEVVAIDSSGAISSPATLEVAGTGGEVEPPANLRSAIYGPRTIELFWDRASISGLKYDVRRNGELLTRTDGVSFFDDGLDPAQSYRYEIVALDSRGNQSMAVAIDVSTGSGIVPTPEGLRIAVYSPNTLELFWDRSATPGQRYIIEGTGISEYVTYATSYFVFGISPGEVSYSVVALDSAGKKSLPVTISTNTLNHDDPPVVDNAIISLSSYENVLRDAIRVINTEPMEGLLASIPADTTFDNIPGASLVFSIDDASSDMLPALPERDNPADNPADYTLAANGTLNQWTCNAGGLITRYSGGFNGEPNYRGFEDCVLSDTELDGVLLNRSFGRPFGQVAAALNLTLANGDGSRRSLSGAITQASTSFVDESAFLGVRGVDYADTTPVDPIQVTNLNAAAIFSDVGIGNNEGGVGGPQPDGSFVIAYFQNVTTTLQANFEMQASWTPVNVAITVDFQNEDTSLRVQEGSDATLEELVNSNGTPLNQLGFDADDSFYWKTGYLRVDAPDASYLELTPIDAERFAVTLGDGTSIERRWDEPGFGIPCPFETCVLPESRGLDRARH